MQHAYDTHLKRDVAIKCIKISQSDIERSRAKISIHDAQVVNATRPLSELGSGRRASDARKDDGAAPILEGGFVPLTAKIAEINQPSFLDKNEERRANRARRQGILKQKRESASIAASYDRQTNVRNYGNVLSVVPEASAGDAGSFDLSDFAAYSNFKNNGHAGRRPPAPMASTTVGLTEIAGNIPGLIDGVGEAQIASIGDDVKAQVIPEEERPSRRSDSGQTATSADMARAAAPATRKPIEPDQPAPSDAGDLDLSLVDNIPGLEEARTAAHLNDANIVTVYDCVVEGDTCYVIMEYVEGKTLAKIMREIGNDITLDMVAAVFNSVSHALEVAHKAGVLHLDVKPENVIVNNDGVVKVTDFGLSTLMDAFGQGVTGGGTIGYMPLEQMRQQRLDVRTDEWALASLTYEMLSGKNPFKARNLRDAEAAIEGAELVIPSLCWESIDESVDDIMFDALSPDMDGRYPDIASFSADLAPILGDARDGTKQLAEVVKGPPALPGKRAEEEKKQQRPPKPYVPFIDKLGMKGSSIMMRVFAMLGTAMMAVIAMMNFRVAFGEGADGQVASGMDTIFGLFSTVPVAAVMILLLLMALAAFRPRWAFPADIVVFVIMLGFNQAWPSALLLLVGAGAWWWFFGRVSDIMCTLALLQPLFGAVGFAPVVPVLAGALLDVRDALATAGMAALGAIVFAALGSDNVMNWDVMANFIVALNPSIAGASISSGLVETFGSLENWVVIAGWLAAAALYSLLCRKGTRTFDIMASVAAAVCIVAGTIVVPIVTGDFSPLTPLTISGITIASVVGVLLALLNVTDRVRLAPGEW